MERLDERGVRVRVPEGVGGEDDVERVMRRPVSGSGPVCGGVEDRGVGAPCVGDGAAARGMVACDVVGEGVDEAVVRVVRGGDEDVGVGFGDEDARQACACAELEDVQRVRGAGGVQAEAVEVVCEVEGGDPDGGGVEGPVGVVWLWSAEGEGVLSGWAGVGEERARGGVGDRGEVVEGLE